MKTRKDNIFAYFLKQLEVKFTNTYISKLYEKSLRRNSLFEIYKMLLIYKIKSIGVRLNSKDEIETLDTPFFVEIDNNIVVIDKCTSGQVYFRWKDKDIVTPLEEFKRRWNGIALLAERTKKTREPGYKENLKKQLIQAVFKNVTSFSLAILFFMGFILNNLYTQPQAILLSITNLIGIYIGYLLIQKQLFIPSKHADKICSIFATGGCNGILNSSAAKFFGIIGWSEIGFSYFLSNLILVVLFPQLGVYFALINLSALPYSFWSLWYQRFKAKQWCPLCLMVQVLLWLVFFINLLFGELSVPQFVITDILFTGIIYILPFLFISFLMSKLINERRLQVVIEEIADLKMRPEVFEALLKKHPYYEIDLSTSKIFWGNPNAQILLTIVTNPHCAPCAIIHKEVKALLEMVGNSICVQYIFLPFSKDFEASNRFLTGIYLSDKIGLEMKTKIYNEWFEYGKYDRETFFSKYKLEVNNELIEKETKSHREWIERNEIQTTPTILINGYELPFNYQVEDIIHFLGLKI